MPLIHWIRRPEWLACCALLAGALGATAAGASGIEDPKREAAYRAVDRAKSSAAGDVRGQADALVALAWPEGGATDPLVSSLAREQLTHYGADALGALRQAIPRVRPEFQFDVVAALIETNANIGGGLPSDYLPAVEDGAWFGSLEAKRMAIPELARYRFPMALLTIMDAAHEHPALVPVAVQALGDYRNDRARKYLLHVLRTGLPHERTLAARALGRIGGRALTTLREAARDEDAGCRSAALATLLPVTGTDDLSLLHEYIALHPEENPSLYRRVLQRAILLEAIQEKQLAAESASGS